MYVLIGLAILVTSAQNLESDVREVIIHFNKFFAPSTLTTKIQNLLDNHKIWHQQNGLRFFELEETDFISIQVSL
jgi:hypothetical protein